MKALFKKTMIATGIGVASVSAMQSAQAFCYIDHNPSVIDTTLKPSFEMVRKGVDSSMKALDKQVEKALGQQTDAITAALTVLAKQKAMTATQVTKAYEENTKIEIAAREAAESAEKQKEILEEYGPTGQGHDDCGVHVKRSEIIKQEKRAKIAVGEMVRTEITARPGRYANRAEQMATRLALHDQLYCTEDQAKSGLCTKAGPRAGKSLMASTMFEPGEYGSDNYEDKSAFINNIMGLADEPLTASQAKTIAGQSYADNKRRTDAIKSTAGTYLKSLQAYWSGTADDPAHTQGQPAKNTQSEARQLQDSKNAGGSSSNPEKAKTADSAEQQSGKETNTSLAKRLKEDVDRYFGGGEEYKKWSQTLVGANERGVMREILQIKALRLKLAAQEFEELSQQEAMLAAYASAVLANSGLEGKIQAQRDQLLRSTISASVTQ